MSAAKRYTNKNAETAAVTWIMIDSSHLLARADERVAESQTDEPEKKHCRQPNDEIHSYSLQGTRQGFGRMPLLESN